MLRSSAGKLAVRAMFTLIEYELPRCDVYFTRVVNLPFFVSNCISMLALFGYFQHALQSFNVHLILLVSFNPPRFTARATVISRVVISKLLNHSLIRSVICRTGEFPMFKLVNDNEKELTYK